MKNPVEIIIKKRDGNNLTEDEIRFMIRNYLSGEIPDYQISAWLMAIYFNGLSKNETIWLTKSMFESGKQFDLSDIQGLKVDKHSTGGVGDKVSLILVPILAAAGLKVAKMSGRGLGHTGGTVDKLRSIPGFKTNLSTDEFIKAVKNCGLAIIGQNEEIVPADKKIYAIRDVTGTISNLSLIASSIMSKKIAGGADYIIIDLKVGLGAFVKNLAQAEELALLLKQLGENFDKKIKIVIDNMNQPLGKNIGNSLEVVEAVEALKGNMSNDLEENVLTLGSQMFLLTGLANDEKESLRMQNKIIEEGKALEKFKEMIFQQNGNPEFISNYKLLPQPAVQSEYKADKSGYISNLNAEKVGKAAMALGAGRIKKEDNINPAAGIVLSKKNGDNVKKGEVIAILYSDNRQKINVAEKIFSQALKIEEKKPETEKMTLKVF